MPSQSAVSSFAFASGAIFTASVGYVFARSSKLKTQSQTSLPFIMTTAPIPAQKKSPPSSPSALRNSFQKLKLFRLKSRRKSTPTVMIFPSQPVVDDDASSICSDSTSIYTITGSVPNLPGALSQAWESSTSTNGFSPRSISEKIEEEEEDMEWCNSDNDEYVEPNRTRASLPIAAPIFPRRKHNRCISLPPDLTLTSGSFYHHQRPSECWDDDNDFSIDDDLVVPNSLKEAQLSLRMNISTIRDFINQIKKLKALRDQKLNLSSIIQPKMTRRWKYGLKFKKYGELEKKFALDWEKVDVIIDLSDVAQDSEPTFGGGKSMEVDIERIPSERHMQVLKTIMEDTDPTFMDNDKENHCDCYLRSCCRKHKNYSDHGHNAKKQKLTDGNSTNDSDNHGKKMKENFRIDVEMMPNLVEHLKSLQKKLSGHVEELEDFARLINLTPSE